MFTKEQLETIAEKLPQKTRHIEQYKDQLIMPFERIYFEFYKQNHNRETNNQYIKAHIIFFGCFDNKDVKWLEKHKITKWYIFGPKLTLSTTVKSEQELISFLTNVLNHFKN